MGAEVKPPVSAACGRGGVIATWLDARKAVISSVKLTVEMSRVREEIIDAGLEESSVGGDPERAVIVVLDLGKVVVVEALPLGEATILPVF